MYSLGGKYIESVNLVEGQIEVITRTPSNMTNAVYAPDGTHASHGSPDTIIKEIYAVVDGVIELIDTVQGTHTPSKFVAESVTFPEH